MKVACCTLNSFVWWRWYKVVIPWRWSKKPELFSEKQLEKIWKSWSMMVLIQCSAIGWITCVFLFMRIQCSAILYMLIYRFYILYPRVVCCSVFLHHIYALFMSDDDTELHTCSAVCVSPSTTVQSLSPFSPRERFKAGNDHRFSAKKYCNRSTYTTKYWTITLRSLNIMN